MTDRYQQSASYIIRIVGLALFVALADLSAGPILAADALSITSALNSIRTEDLQQHVNVLASDTFEGREAGSRGGRAAAAYLATELKKLGVEPRGTGGTYFQDFGSNFRNVVGVIAGDDPRLSREYILIGAHYDHVGYGSRQNSFGPLGRIHNGADDNASGLATLLELIEACTLLPSKPRRSLLFAFWDAEEMGLLGSKHWVNSPTVPLHSVVLALNVDMVGRLREQTLEIYGTRSTTGLRRFVSQSNRADKLKLDFPWDNTSDSDHYPFFSNSIPYLMLHTRKHDDYHRPSDDPDKVNFDGIENISRLMFHLLTAAADVPHWAGFRHASREETNQLRDQRSFAPAPPSPRLGVGWDSNAAGDVGVRLNAIAAGSAAAKAGLLVGDVLLELAGRRLDGTYDFRTHVMAARNPVSVVLRRNGELLDKVVQLEGRPIRVGITWRLDDAEPDCLILRSVAPGSPADQAGLRPGDRIYSRSNEAAVSEREFAEWVVAQQETIDLRIERDGGIRSVQIRLLPSVD